MFDDVIADILVYKNYTSDPRIIHLWKKIKHFTFLIIKPYIAVPKNVGLNSTHNFL